MAAIIKRIGWGRYCFGRWLILWLFPLAGKPCIFPSFFTASLIGRQNRHYKRSTRVFMKEDRRKKFVTVL